MPRRPGDFTDNDDIYRSLAENDAPSNEQPVRKISEMIDEAERIKFYLKDST